MNKAIATKKNIKLEDASSELKSSVETRQKNIAGELNDVAKEMAREVVLMLGAEVEEANTASHDFKSAIEATTQRIMIHVDKSQDQVCIYEEALPGFTLMAIKETNQRIFNHSHSLAEGIEFLNASDLSEDTYEAASLMIDQFMSKTRKRILVMKHPKVLLILFPVSDTRKHMKALGLYAF
jgi:hypothetical protein